jgi:hypothetical protein
MLKICLTFLNILGQVKNYLVDSFWSSTGETKYGERIAQAFTHFIKNRCTSEDLRTSQKKDIATFSSNVESILDSATATMTSDQKIEKVYLISETLELEIAFKCLKMPVLEKKLIGH